MCTTWLHWEGGLEVQLFTQLNKRITKLTMADSTQNNYIDHCPLSKVKIYMTHEEFPLPPIMWMSQKILEARKRDHRPIKIFCPHIHMHKAMSISTRSSASAVKCIKVIQKGTRKNLWTSIHSSFRKYLWYKIIQYQLQHPKTKFFKTEKEAKLFIVVTLK